MSTTDQNSIRKQKNDHDSEDLQVESVRHYSHLLHGYQLMSSSEPLPWIPQSEFNH